jgi:acetyltransferase
VETAFEPFEVERRGTRIRVRAILPSDSEEILQAYDRMSPEARYMRFMSTRNAPEVGRLRAALGRMPERGLVIAATVPATDGLDIIGTASFVIGPEPGQCEFAVAVVNAWAGVGMGGTLLEALVAAARRRGLSSMQGFVLAENRAMLRLAQRLGFTVERQPGDYSVKVCTLPLV